MNNYIDTNNNIWGFNDTQKSLIPIGAVEIPNTYTFDQYPYLTLDNGVINFNSSAYNSDVNAKEIANCKEQAQVLLKNTDWTEIPSVTNTANTPHLINSDEFVTYRNFIRILAVNPIANPSWPPVPTEQWSS